MQPDNLIAILQERKMLNDTGITFIEGNNRDEFLSYGELYHAALRGLCFLQRHGIRPKDQLVFQIGDNKTFVIIFWACILGGIIPVPLTIGNNEDHKLKLFNVWAVLDKPNLVISRENLDKLGLFAGSGPLATALAEMESNWIDEEGALSAGEEGLIFPAEKGDIAFVQFSSGSTGSPKGITLTHENLMTNMRAIAKAGAYSPDDAMLSWMPLTHDMGLIGFHLNPLFSGMRQYLMPATLFVRRPALWLDKASAYKVSILSSPNFGYEYLMKHVDSGGGQHWDLSSVRIIYNGAEPVSVQLCHQFLDFLAKYELKKVAMCPVYGLAEASLAVSIPGLHEEVRWLALDRNKLNLLDRISLAGGNSNPVSGNADPAEAGIENAVSFANVGRPIEDCAVRIAGEGDTALPNETIGHIQISGKNVTAGYYNNPTATGQAFTRDGWLRTGDLGFMKDGSLYITGRAKDIIFVNGQNYYPHDLERMAQEVRGIELNKIAIAGFFNDRTGKEEVVAFVFNRGSLAEFAPLAPLIKSCINHRTGVEISRVIPVKDMPRTTSGKLQRFKLVEQYRKGEYDQAEAALHKELEGSAPGEMLIVEPRNEEERKILRIWEKVLHVEGISVTRDFFRMGGNSLKAAEVSMLVSKELQVDMPVGILYKRRTIRDLAAGIASCGKLDYTPIPVMPEALHYPVSSAQKRLYYYWAFNKSSIAYNLPVAFRFEGKLEKERLENSIRQLIGRHDSLRTSFQLLDEPVCRIDENIDFRMEFLDGGDEAGGDNALRALCKSLVRPFDLANGSLLRCTLITAGRDRYILFADFHHIISDGVSIYQFIQEMLEVYDGKVLSPLSCSYKDYIFWEKAVLEGEGLARQKEFWLDQFHDGLPLLDLPLDHPRPVIFNPEGAKIPFGLGGARTAMLREFADANGYTLHVLLFTIYNLLLSKYTGQEDLLCGIPVAGRRHPDLQQLQGMFVNNLAIRTTIKGAESFTGLLEKVKANMTAALDNQDYPFEYLVQHIGAKRDIGRNPLFDTMFLYQNMGTPGSATNGPSVSRYFFDPGFSKFDISMEVFEEDGSVQYAIEYAKSLFSQETIFSMARHFEQLIDRIIDGPDKLISDLSMLSGEESEEYIQKVNEPERPSLTGATIVNLFGDQVKITPDNIALEFERERMTYRQLNEKAEQLAALLIDAGLSPGNIIAILLPRTADLVISILAILKAGGAYLPIDTDLPEERIRYIITDSRCGIIVTDDAHESRIQGLGQLRTVHVDQPGATLVSGEPGSLKPRSLDPEPDDLAYVIYTSGTTGMPKGVMIEHRSLVNYIVWAAENYCKGEAGDFPLFTSISFDLTITSIFVPLVTGNRIIIYKEEDNAMAMERVIKDNSVQVIKLTPSHLKIFAGYKSRTPDAASNVRAFIVGGEQLDTRLARQIFDLYNGEVGIYNEYGPTEATVGCMIYKFKGSETREFVPIGVPAANTRIYLLDRFLKPVPSGVKGEMYIGGAGVARGYLFNEVLTIQKFVPDPFRADEKMYKTGDIAKRLPAGVIEFLGRSDQQVKISGYRIELTEIENQLLSHPGIEEALVTVRMNKKEQKSICAYYIPTQSHERPDEPALRSYLAGRLPHYMIPIFFIPLEKIPLTKNGKIDHGSLPDPALYAIAGDGPMPRNEIESLLTQIFEEVLGEEHLTIADNFFEVGGDSIKAVQIVSRLGAKGISLSVKDILTYHTIRQISPHARRENSTSPYEQGIVSGERSLLPIESWFFSRHFRNPSYYNQSVALKIGKDLNYQLLEMAFCVLIEHHDGLRMNYDPKKNVMFYNHRHLRPDFKMGVFEIEAGKEAAKFCESFKAGFDISESLLIKAAIFRSVNDNDILFITAHHLVMDGVSWRILLDDLYRVYHALESGESVEFPRKTATSKDWEKAIRSHTDPATSKDVHDYWEQVSSTEFHVPVDYRTDDWTVGNMTKITGSLNEESTDYLVKEAHTTYNTDIPILLNTALALTMRDWTGADTCVIEQEGHGRQSELAGLQGQEDLAGSQGQEDLAGSQGQEDLAGLRRQVDLSGTIGWFTALYPVKLELQGYSTGDWIMAIKEQLKAVPDHGIGYGVNKYMDRSDGTDRLPAAGRLSESSRLSEAGRLSEVRLNYLGRFDKELNNDLFSFLDLPLGPESDPSNSMTAKLEINMMIAGGRLQLDMHYNKKAYGQATMKRVVSGFFRHLEDILDHIRKERDTHFTPSDFNLVDLDQGELDALF